MGIYDPCHKLYMLALVFNGDSILAKEKFKKELIAMR
jgi:hypothetical protein